MHGTIPQVSQVLCLVRIGRIVYLVTYSSVGKNEIVMTKPHWPTCVLKLSHHRQFYMDVGDVQGIQHNTVTNNQCKHTRLDYLVAVLARK
jgi:hypothetical protein